MLVLYLVQGSCGFMVSQFGLLFFCHKNTPTHTLYEDFLDLDADIRGSNNNCNANLALATTHSDNSENPVEGFRLFPERCPFLPAGQ